MKSKIIIFSLFILSFVGILGCGDKVAEKLGEKHIIPYVPVYTRILWNFGGEDELSWLHAPKYFPTSTPDGKPLGYNGHGIIIYTENGNDFYCYDATCTSCTDLTSHFEQKNLKESIAKCPVCGVEFSLILGQPFNAASKIYPLKNYPVVKNGKYLTVSY